MQKMVTRKGTPQNGQGLGKRKARLKKSYAESSGSEEGSIDEDDFEPSLKMRKRSTGRTPARPKSSVSRNRKARTPISMKQNSEEDIRGGYSRSAKGMNVPVGQKIISFFQKCICLVGT